MVYDALFNDIGISGLKEAWLLFTWRLFGREDVEVHKGLENYFQDLNKDVPLVQEYFNKILKKETVAKVYEQRMKGMIAVHVRLGDYVPEMRVDISWYRGVIESIIKDYPQQKFALFSDGSDEELQSLLSLPNVERCFFGNAFADMWAISKCKFVIASDSTFSAWGAFLGQLPILFSKRHFPPVYDGRIPEAVLGTSNHIPIEFKRFL